MRFILSTAAVFVIALGVLTACTDTAPKANSNRASGTTANNGTGNSATANNATTATTAPKTGQLDDAPRINLADAKKEFDAGTAVFVDTRAEVSYRAEHVKGAINLPMEAVELRYKEIPTGKKIIAYCS